MTGRVLDKPDFVIIGAMKCATSTLHDQLAMQPGIFMSDPKEPNFFSDPEIWERGMAWYTALFEDAPDDAICGESSTHYTKLPTYPACAQRLFEALPSAKLIYVMRHPLDRLVSHYVHAWSMREIDDGVSVSDAIHSYPQLVQYSQYWMQLEPYVERYGPERILPVFAERLRSRPQAELERICRHIGYPEAPAWSQDTSDRNVSAGRQRRHPALDAILRVRALQVLRRTLLPASLRGRLKSRWTMRERPALSADALAYVTAQIDPDLALLGARLGLELSSATYRDAIDQEASPTWRGEPPRHAE